MISIDKTNVSPWEIPVLITQRVEVTLGTTEKPCTAHSACVLYLSKLTADVRMWLLSSCHMLPAARGAGLSLAELNLNGHTWLPYWTAQLSATANSALSMLAPPTSFSRPASNTAGILRRALYKLLHLSLIP